MSKLWICGICQNNKKELYELLEKVNEAKTHPGILFVDGGSTDETQEVITNWGGQFLRRKWTNDHDFQMNVYMRAGIIQHGDWVVQIDSSERIEPAFIDKLNGGMLANFEEQGIKTVYQRSKPILFQYHDDQIFSGSPHWGLQGQRRHLVDISKFDGFEDDKTYFWSQRDDINKWITNGMKYYYVYGRSNHMWLVYSQANYPGTTDTLIHEHEATRMQFRDYCRYELGLKMNNLDDITKFMKDTSLELLPSKFREFMAYEKVIANYYRYIHGEDQQIIYDTQNTWKF